MVSQTKEEFREEQKQKAAEQGQTQENAVPEQRPASFDQGPGPSELAQKIEEATDTDPMPKSAFEKAEKGAGKDNPDEQQDILHTGNAVEVIDEDSVHHGRKGAIVRDIRDGDGGRGPASAYVRLEPFDEHEVALLGDERGNEHVIFKDDQLKRIDQKLLGWT